MKIITYCILLSAIFSACATVKLDVPDKFQAVSEKMHIKGANSWVLRQKLSFGKYNTSPVKRGWISTTEENYYTTSQRLMMVFDIDNFSSTEKQKNRFRYVINDGVNHAEVFCQEKMTRNEIKVRTNSKILGDLSRTEDWEYSFSAAILPSKDTSQAPWQLVVYNTYDRSKDTARKLFDLPYVEEQGYVTNGSERIEIRPLRLTSVVTKKGSEKQFPVKILSGYELKIDDGVIAIIDKLDNNLWIYKELDEPTRLIVAATSAALLLRQLEDKGSSF